MSDITPVDVTVVVASAQVSSLVVAVPALVADGHVMVMAVWKDDDTIATAVAITGGGWTWLGSDNRFTYFVRPVPDASMEPASYTATWTGAHRAVATIVTFANVDPINPIAGFVQSLTGDIPLTLAAGRYYLLVGNEVDSGAVVFTAPAGWVVLAQGETGGTYIDTAHESAVMAGKPFFGIAASSPVTFGSNHGAFNASTQIALRAVADPATPVGWDAYSAGAPNGDLLATIQDDAAPLEGTTARAVRVELNGTGSGAFRVNRYSAVATEAVLARDNVVKCRFPWRDDYDFAFLLEQGDFTLAAHNENGGEEFAFGGRGLLAYLERAVMDAVAYTTGLDVADHFEELWHASVPTPTGVAYLTGDPDHVYTISSSTRRIYKVRQSDHKVVGTSPALWSGSDNYAAGLTADPTDATIMWALEAPWARGGSGNTKIRKVDVTGSISSWAVANTYDLGSAVHLSDIRASTSHLWTTRYDTGKIQRRTRAAPATVNADWTVTYQGNAQTHPNGAAISENGTGAEIAMWFGGTAAGGVRRALVANLTDPSTVTRVLNTSDIASFGGDWSEESGQTYFYMVSYTLGRLWKYQLTAATPHDPVDGIWRLDEGTPGAVLWRVIAEATDAARPQQPLPDLAIGFGPTTDGNGEPWDEHDGTLEFDARITEPVLDVALRLMPYGLIEQMSPYVVLSARNASSYGTDRSSAAFAPGKVRFEKGVNIIPELGRQERARPLHSHMLATGKGALYARAVQADLGYVREGGFTTELEDATALAGQADAALDDERAKSERIRFAVPIGDDEANGLYLPFTHYAVGDLVTLHTGSGEHDFTDEVFVLYAFTLEESTSGTWEQAVIELGSATLVGADATGSGSSSGSGGGSTSPGGGGTTISAPDVTVQGTDDTGTVVTSALGRTIRSAAWQVYQRGTGVIEVVLAAAGRLLGLSDVDADGIRDQQLLAYDEATATFVPADRSLVNVSHLITATAFPIILHRGDINPVDGYPEDSLEAHRQGMARGAHGSEFGVQRDADGTWQVFHDLTVDRTTNGAGAVASKTTAQMAALVIDGGFGYDAGRHAALTLHPPTLAQVLEVLLPYDAIIMLNPKEENLEQYTALAEFVRDLGIQERVVILVPDAGGGALAKAVAPRIVTDDTMTLTEVANIVNAAYVQGFEPRALWAYAEVSLHYGDDETSMITDMWTYGVRGFLTNDLPNALLIRNAVVLGISASSAPAGPAGGDLAGTYPSPSVVDDSHSHTASTAPGGRWELAVIAGSPPDSLYADGDWLYILVP